MELLTLILIFIIGFITSIFGIMVGSSGLLRIPLLILLGLPPQIAVASNRVGSIAMCITGLYKYGKEKLVDLKVGSKLIIIKIIGVIIGAYILISLSDLLIQKIIAIVIFIVVILLITNKDLGLEKKKKTRKNIIIGSILYLIVSIYGGFIGGGAGTIETIILISFFGLTFLNSAATRRIPGLIGAIITVIIFTYYGLINWPVAGTLFVSQSFGAWVGSSIAIKKGNKFVKTIFILVALALAVKLLIS